MKVKMSSFPPQQSLEMQEVQLKAVSGASLLKIDIPSIISRARKKIIKEPATANELISIPIRFSISSPTNKNPTIIIAAIIEAFSD